MATPKWARKNNNPTQIAQASADAAEGARRDSSSMKTIAALTLVFLPATTIAVIDPSPLSIHH